MTTVLFTVKYTLPLTISHSASDLHKRLYWAMTWQVDFNVSKFSIFSGTTKRNISAYDYFTGSQQILRTDNQDYMGATINTKLSWQLHINKGQNKASKTLGLLKRTLHAAPPQLATNARVCYMRLATSHKDRHSDNRARTKIGCAV